MVATRVSMVLLSSAVDQAIAIRGVREGAHYLIKSQIDPRELMRSLLDSAERKIQEELSHSAQHDFLTGLPNRTLLKDRVSQAIALAHRQKGQAAVLFLDLDGFKYINDSLGHHIGDRVLQCTAKRLVNCLRVPDTVSRFGGDEFVVVLQELKHPEEAATTANRLLRAVPKVHFIVVLVARLFVTNLERANHSSVVARDSRRPGCNQAHSTSPFGSSKLSDLINCGQICALRRSIL